ncbi:GTP cyclohydrolase, FolE2/MptA family [Streptomyces sp. NPDC001307]|uniref:GTP cyclohydrolase, FolE2/MptA family n=1 Tax=Streptomyces sp. NPDC001307 TaxID=3364560 RepID=UPI0036B9A9BF
MPPPRPGRRHPRHRRGGGGGGGGGGAPRPPPPPPPPPATSLCPCSKAISDDDTHNQRSEITLEVTGISDTPYPLPVHEMVDLPRAAGSAPVIPRIKHPTNAS